VDEVAADANNRIRGIESKRKADLAQALDLCRERVPWPQAGSAQAAPTAVKGPTAARGVFNSIGQDQSLTDGNKNP
jgi:hypothetical protein